MPNTYSNSVKYKLCKIFTTAIISSFFLTIGAIVPQMVLSSGDLRAKVDWELQALYQQNQVNFFSSLANLLEGNFQILVNDMAILKAAEELTANENNKTGAVVWPTQGNIDTRNWSLPL